MESYEVVRLIEKNNQCIVFELKHLYNRQPACVKVISYENEAKLSKIVNEVMNLSRIGNLSMGLKVYGFDLKSDGLKSILRKSQIEGIHAGSNNKKSAFIITEFCQNGNLDNHVKARRKNNKAFTYKEIISIFSSFINFFAELQSQKIVHRDIKPQNIYVTRFGEYKVGDFGSSKFMQHNQDEHTITGTGTYFSPEMRKGHQKFQERIGGLQIECDPIKSDVFSLGLVFIYFIQMQNVTSEDTNLELFEKRINSAIGKYPYRIVREILGSMLKFKINERLNFIEIKNILIPILLSEKCIGCNEGFIDQKINCMDCEIAYHVGCASKINKCLNCEKDLNIRCSKCLNVGKLQCGAHRLCEHCSVENIECQKCFGLELREGKTDRFNFYVDDFYCFSCEIRLVPSIGQNSTECERCHNKWCKLCKRTIHSYGCFIDPSPLSFMCKCRHKSIAPFSGLFFACRNCGPVCIVCFGSSEKSHVRCAQALNQPNILA